MKKNKDYQVVKSPPYRKLIIDFTRLARRQSTIFGLGEFDITETRKKIRKYRVEKKEQISLTAYMISCIGKTVKKNPALHAYKNWRNRLILFTDVDLLLPVEMKIGEYTFPAIHILRAVNKRNAADIEREINKVKTEGIDNPLYKKRWKYLKLFLFLPGFLRRLIWSCLMISPKLMRKHLGTVAVTAVGMFGSGGGWGMGLSNHTLEIVIGGIYKKPLLVKGKLEEREFLPVTLCLDHDIIDGGPAARFARDFRSLVENGSGL